MTQPSMLTKVLVLLMMFLPTLGLGALLAANAILGFRSIDDFNARGIETAATVKAVSQNVYQRNLISTSTSYNATVDWQDAAGTAHSSELQVPGELAQSLMSGLKARQGLPNADVRLNLSPQRLKIKYLPQTFEVRLAGGALDDEDRGRYRALLGFSTFLVLLGLLLLVRMLIVQRRARLPPTN